MPSARYRWATAGDINAFFGLMLDNVADLVLLVGLLTQVSGLPAEFTLRYMVPGTAMGVLFGDLVYTWMAFRLARRTGRDDVTAMPLGLDTPSTVGMVVFVLGPAYHAAHARLGDVAAAAQHTWHIGICVLLISGIFKLACALGSGAVRRLLPRAGLLGSLTAIALVLISFLPLLEIFESPLVGLTALAIVLTTLIARVEFPGRIPGALAALLVGTLLHFALRGFGLSHLPASAPTEVVWFPSEWLIAWQGQWWHAGRDALDYLPVVIPFALATVVGGIDCTESAAAAGDEYDTRAVIAVEGIATLVAGLCGGVVQSVPYIGQPAYKALGARAAYTLFTALSVGSAGVVGYFGLLYVWLPKAALFPILIFIGLEITAQSFAATPRRHYPAVALACVPAMAYLVMMFAGNLLDATHQSVDELPAPLADQLSTLRMLAGGFFVTSLLWGSMLAALIDRRLSTAAVYCLVAAMCALLGIIHSPLPDSPLVLPWNLPASPAHGPSPLAVAAAYGLTALLLAAWHLWLMRHAAATHSK